MGLTLCGPEDSIRADLWVDPEGGSTLRMHDASENVRIDLNDENGIEISDAKGQTIWSSRLNRKTEVQTENPAAGPISEDVAE